MLSSQTLDVGAQVYSFDPRTEKIRHLGDLTEICGEKGLKAIPQNKSHVRFWEANDKLYFASHIGYYTIKNGMETPGVPPPGYKPYPGGHFLSYDMATGKFKNLALAPHNEGIIAMTMDPARGRLYGETWPTGYFISYDLHTKQLKDLGLYAALGESVRGPIYRGGKRVAGKIVALKGESKGEEDLHLITYYIPSGKYIDHGAVFFPDGQRPREVNSIAVGLDGSVYALAAVDQNGHDRTDLIRIPGPISSH